MVSSSLSAVICTQNDERTIKACAESFLNFCEEVIVVVNNSTDRTWDIISAVNDDVFFGKLIKIKVDGITDLSEARNMGFSISSGDWIIRADGDFICYSERDGKFSPFNFREHLSRRLSILPTVYYVPQLNLFRDFDTVGDGKYAFSPFDEPRMPRIYSRNLLLKFKRLGRDEGVPYLFFYIKKKLDLPLWIHATFKNKVDIRLSHGWRRDWRELGDYNKFPTLMDYVYKVKLPAQYPGLSLEEASEQFYAEKVAPSLTPIPSNPKWPVPQHIRELDV